MSSGCSGWDKVRSCWESYRISLSCSAAFFPGEYSSLDLRALLLRCCSRRSVVAQWLVHLPLVIEVMVRSGRENICCPNMRHV